MSAADTIYLAVHDLNYQGKTTAQAVTREQFHRLKRWDSRHLRERVSPTRYAALMREEARERYDKAIQAKYKVGPGWRLNRYFVEQVRPTLAN